MDDFEHRLEIELAHMLDPIVDAPAPRRRRHVSLRAIAGGLDGQPDPAAVLIGVVSEPIPVAVAPVGTSL